MKIEAIVQAIEEDSSIDEAKLDKESINTVKLHSKWIVILFNEERVLKSLLLEKDKEYKNKTEFYSGKKTDKEYKEKQFHQTVLKKDLDYYINADNEFQTIRGKIEVQQLKVDLIKEFIKQLNQRGFIIKNAIDFKKFNNGGY